MKNLLVILFVVFAQVGFGQNKMVDKATKLIKEKEQYFKALSILDSYIEHDSSNAKAFTQRGICYLRIGKYDKAFSDLNVSLQLDSNSAETYCGIATVLAMKNKYDKSLNTYNKALEIDKEHVSSYNSRGALKFYFLNDTLGALSDYNRALNIMPKNSSSLYNRGILYNYKGEYTKAIIDLTKSLKLNSKKADAHDARATSNFYLGHYKLAIKDFKKVIKYNKPIGSFGLLDIGEINYYIGLCYEELNNEEKAKIYFEKAEKLGYE